MQSVEKCGIIIILINLCKKFFRGGEMEKFKRYIVRQKLKKALGRENYANLIEDAHDKFRASDEYTQNKEVKMLVNQMQDLKRGVFVGKVLEVLGVSMAGVSCYRIEDYPMSQMITMMGLGVAGSIVAHLVKKHSQSKYAVAEDILSEYIVASGAMDQFKEYSITEDSMDIPCNDVCDQVVDSQHVLDAYWG